MYKVSGRIVNEQPIPKTSQFCRELRFKNMYNKQIGVVGGEILDLV